MRVRVPPFGPQMIVETILCLALNVYHEARGEPKVGQYAVAYVTLNRANHPNFPNTVCGVVYQPYQFSWTRYNQHLPKDAGWDTALRSAIQVYFGMAKDPTSGSLFYHNNTVKPKWAPKLKHTVRISNHIFYTYK